MCDRATGAYRYNIGPVFGPTLERSPFYCRYSAYTRKSVRVAYDVDRY